MVIDTSAIVAIALDELEAADFERRIADDPIRLISAATFFEAAMVIESRFGEIGGSELDLWLHKARWRSSPSEPNTPTRPAAPGAASAADVTQLASTSAIASPMRWRR